MSNKTAQIPELCLLFGLASNDLESLVISGLLTCSTLVDL